MTDRSLFNRLKSGLAKTRDLLSPGFSNQKAAELELSDELLEDFEERLLMADVGIELVQTLINQLKLDVAQAKRENLPTTVSDLFKKLIVTLLEPCNQAIMLGDNKPFAILVVGVNGAGKTTTIGKLARRLKRNRKQVMLAAGDTFRAAAVEQLVTWGERNDVPVVAQATGADSAAVIFDALESAKARNIDVLIADTAGRLHTQNDLMTELQKVKRVMQKVDPAAPHETLLVIDASMGQNALRQAQEFHRSMQLTGLCITKLDGTAKGGVFLSIAYQLGLPIRYIGVGEAIEDLQVFDAVQFADALLGLEPDT